MIHSFLVLCFLVLINVTQAFNLSRLRTKLPIHRSKCHFSAVPPSHRSSADQRKENHGWLKPRGELDEELSMLLQKELIQFESTHPRLDPADPPFPVELPAEAKPSSSNSSFRPVKAVRDAVAVVLVVDFFVVLGFLAWFIAGIALQGSTPFILQRFQVSRELTLIDTNFQSPIFICVFMSPAVHV